MVPRRSSNPTPTRAAAAIRAVAASFLLWTEPGEAFQLASVASRSGRYSEHHQSSLVLLGSNQQREHDLSVVSISSRGSSNNDSQGRIGFRRNFSTGLRATKQDEATAEAATSSSSTVTTAPSFIDGELRGAAMRLHTRSQAPREGKATEPTNQEPHVTTLQEYLQFLVDSQLVFQALEDAVNSREELKMFRNTGLERTQALEQDIAWICQQYKLDRPDVADPGRTYARLLADMKSVPEFVCHWYNHYFAHTAGGRMIGKQMCARLLDNRTLEFYKVRYCCVARRNIICSRVHFVNVAHFLTLLQYYHFAEQWEGDLNEMKATTKQIIEDLAASWTPEERKECVDATAAAFQGGGSLVSHLSGGASSPH
jgi:heme oxygenase (biliverdin-producing, ferredoxin)